MLSKKLLRSKSENLEQRSTNRTSSECNGKITIVESQEGILPLDAKIRHEIPDTAASPASVNPEKKKKEGKKNQKLSARCYIALALKESRNQ